MSRFSEAAHTEVNSDVKRDTKESELMQPLGGLHSITDNRDRLRTG